MASLTIRLQEFSETPSRFWLKADRDWWQTACAVLQEPDLRVERDFEAELEGYCLGARLILRGRVSGAVSLPCGRCMEPYTHEVSEPLELLLEPALRPEEIPEGGIELDAEDLELGRYAGEELDFGPVILEILALAWPMQPRCAEECRGLCPVCGSNQNLNPCQCQAEERSRPFAALGKLLEPSKREKAEG